VIPTARTSLAPAAFAVAALALGGCSEELGPEPRITTTITGRVHIRGRPVSGGWIEFLPAEGTIGHLRSAPLRRDGTFEASKVAVGRNAVQIVHPPIPLPGGALFRNQALIRRDVTGDPVDIDLQTEWINLQRKLGRG
jgi:hypothetical protein